MAITRTSGAFNFGTQPYAGGSPTKFLSDGDFIVLNAYSTGFGIDFSQTEEDKIAKITLYTNCTSGTVKETWYNDGSTWLSVNSTANSDGIFEIAIPSSNTPPNVIAVRFNAVNEVWWKMEVEYSDGQKENNYRDVIFKGNEVGNPEFNTQQVLHMTSADNYLTISGAEIDFDLSENGDIGILYLPRALTTRDGVNQPITAPAQTVSGSNDFSVPVIQLNTGKNYLFTSVSTDGASWDAQPTWNNVRIESNHARYIAVKITRETASKYWFDNMYSNDGITWTTVARGTGSEHSAPPFTPIGLIGIGCGHYENDLVQYFRGYLDIATFRYEKNGVETWSACGEPTPVVTSNIYLGGTNISNIYLGAESVDKIYLGSELIFKN